MNVTTDRQATVVWSVAFAVAYLALTIVVSLLSNHHLHLAAWLPALILWPVNAALDGAAYAPAWAEGAPRPASKGRPARVRALRWTLCALILANAVLLLWRAFIPGDSALSVADLDVRLLPLDVRWTPAGLDPLALGLGLGLGFLGLCELRLRLARPAGPVGAN